MDVLDDDGLWMFWFHCGSMPPSPTRNVSFFSGGASINPSDFCFVFPMVDLPAQKAAAFKPDNGDFIY